MDFRPVNKSDKKWIGARLYLDKPFHCCPPAYGQMKPE